MKKQNLEYLGKYCKVNLLENVSKLNVTVAAKGPMAAAMLKSTSGKESIQGLIVDAPLKGRFWSLLWEGKIVHIYKSETNKNPFGIYFTQE
jgi:hypothetical protein